LGEVPLECLGRVAQALGNLSKPERLLSPIKNCSNEFQTTFLINLRRRVSIQTTPRESFPLKSSIEESEMTCHDLKWGDVADIAEFKKTLK